MQLTPSGQLTQAHSTTMTFARHEDGDVTTLAVLVVEHERPMAIIEVNSALVSGITEWVANTASGKKDQDHAGAKGNAEGSDRYRKVGADD